MEKKIGHENLGSMTGGLIGSFSGAYIGDKLHKKKIDKYFKDRGIESNSDKTRDRMYDSLTNPYCSEINNFDVKKKNGKKYVKIHGEKERDIFRK